MTVTSTARGGSVRAVDGPRLVATGALVAEAALFVAFVTVVRAEPRWDLAAAGVLVLAVAALAWRGPAWAPVLAVPVSLAVLDRVQVYVPFSLERPDQPVGLLFSLACLLAVGAGVAGGTATLGRLVAARGRSRAVGATPVLVASVLVAVALGGVLAAGAQPDQREGLGAAEVAALPTVAMDDYRYSPATIEARPGEELVLRLVNDDTETYGFAIAELGVDVTVPSGRDAVVRLRPTTAGSYVISSAQENGEHRELGMTALLVVG